MNVCLITLWIYCKNQHKRKWNWNWNKNVNDTLEQLSNISDDEDKDQIISPQMKFDPGNVQDLLDGDEQNLIELNTDID